MTPLEKEIYAKASEAEDGQYLLPHKYTNTPDPQWEACGTLVDRGYAKWLPSMSDYAPGIHLTGKPLSREDEA